MLLATVLSLVLYCTVGAAPAEAAPAEAATDDVGQTAEPPAKDEGSGDQQKKAGSKDDEFIPTEEISEDFAVSFPVDI
jgi:hypothetical protein